MKHPRICVMVRRYSTYIVRVDKIYDDYGFMIPSHNLDNISMQKGKEKEVNISWSMDDQWDTSMGWELQILDPYTSGGFLNRMNFMIHYLLK